MKFQRIYFHIHLKKHSQLLSKILKNLPNIYHLVFPILSRFCRIVAYDYFTYHSWHFMNDFAPHSVVVCVSFSRKEILVFLIKSSLTKSTMPLPLTAKSSLIMFLNLKDLYFSKSSVINGFFLINTFS
jgi:hypothetical protein